MSESTLQMLIAGGQTVNFMEQIALDQTLLLRNLFPHVDCDFAALKDPRLVTRMRHGGQIMLDLFGSDCVEKLLTHQSDTVRGWGAMAVGLLPEISIEDRLRLASIYGNDPHFGVREWAWISVRDSIIAELDAAVIYLNRRTRNRSPYIRRFCSEATRPIGVWSRHIVELKANPWKALKLITNLRNDPANYVQDSVANWLNDAAKSHPEWVFETCINWCNEQDSRVSSRLIKRATRSLPPHMKVTREV